MTNTGSQWKDAAGTWLKEDLFKDAYEVTIARLWNYFQKHYLISTKQEISNIKRPLYMKDFEYLLHAKFQQGTKKQTINQKEFNWFWDWIGPGLKKLDTKNIYCGYLKMAISPPLSPPRRQKSNYGRKRRAPSSFASPNASTANSSFRIPTAPGFDTTSYSQTTPQTKKKPSSIFLGQNKIFIYILQVNTQPTGKRVFYKHNKDKVLQKYYKRQPKQSSLAPRLESNPYDTRLPYDLNAL